MSNQRNISDIRVGKRHRIDLGDVAGLGASFVGGRMTAPALDITRGGVRKPLAIDLFCGLGGFSEGALAEGFDVIGFDVERHVYGEHRYPAQLVIQDVLTLHGSQFRDASLIVASPPCQFFSYCAMPWSRAKALAAKVRADSALLEKELALFNASFRIQREACEAAGRHIPMVVENVKGAQPWVGRARFNFGSFYLWGDVPALMPQTSHAVKVSGLNWNGSDKLGYVAKAFNDTAVERLGIKVPGFRFDGSGRSFQSASVEVYHQLPSASPRRKAASAMIAKIPEPLSRWIARCFLPRAEEAA